MPARLPNLKQLTDTLFVHSALEPKDMSIVAALGFKSVIINLPDYELSDSQIEASEIIKAAQAVNLEIIYQPVVTAKINRSDCDTFHQNLDTLPKPTLAFCRSGNRCTLLFHGNIAP